MMMDTETADRMIETTLHEVGKLKQVITDIRAANHHATEVIEHLRNLLKRRGEAELEEFDLNEVIAEVVQLLMPEATRRSVNLRFSKVQTQGPLLVRADRIHLQQALLNLVNNGLDEMTDLALTDRMITIQTTLPDKSRVEVAVSDSGPGIPADKMKKVFDTFYTTKKKGIGLGLSIARAIVESYGGKIWAKNRIDGGAVFRFTLPLLRPA